MDRRMLFISSFITSLQWNDNFVQPSYISQRVSIQSHALLFYGSYKRAFWLDAVFPYFDIRLLILSAQTIFVEPISPNKLPLQILNPFQRQKHLVIYGTLRSNEYPHRFRIQFSLSHLLYNHIYSLKRCFFLCREIFCYPLNYMYTRINYKHLPLNKINQIFFSLFRSLCSLAQLSLFSRFHSILAMALRHVICISAYGVIKFIGVQICVLRQVEELFKPAKSINCY